MAKVTRRSSAGKRAIPAAKMDALTKRDIYVPLPPKKKEPLIDGPSIKGAAFGLTSGIITTLGMIVGMHSFGGVAGSKLVVLGAVVSIAIADSFSDALGMHISQESDKKVSTKGVWKATLATFLAKLIFASTFLLPIILLQLSTAIVVSIIWGLSVLALISYFIAKEDGKNPLEVIFEHVGIAGVVIFVTHFVGDWISVAFV